MTAAVAGEACVPRGIEVPRPHGVPRVEARRDDRVATGRAPVLEKRRNVRGAERVGGEERVSEAIAGLGRRGSGTARRGALPGGQPTRLDQEPLAPPEPARGVGTPQ